MYFNIYDFGNNADGIRSAASIYFGKEPHELDLKESAMLVGMFKNSSLYNPRPQHNPVGTETEEMWCWTKWKNMIIVDEKINRFPIRKLDLGFTLFATIA